MMNNLNAWFFYLLVDVVATIALGKLSKVKGDKDDVKALNLLRGIWAPIILFFLGGPDSMTILRLEENKIWLKHVLALGTLGLRTSYILIVTWTWKSGYAFSLLALLMLFPGLIKYGERVWVIKSRGKERYNGFVQLDLSTIDKIIHAQEQRPNSKLVIQAYSCFETLKPHIPNYKCNRTRLHKLVEEFKEWAGAVDESKRHDTFKLIEIELGLMYDMIFSKVGTIFTLWGSILRFISFCCLVTVLVGFFLFHKPGGYWKMDLPITIVLIVGALFLEIGGVIMQFGSDWAIVWACKHYKRKLVTPVFYLHELVIFKGKRWSELMGQFSLLNFCSKNKPKRFNKLVEAMRGRESMWKKSCLPFSSVESSLKELIINQLREKPKNISKVDNLQASTMKIVEETLEKHKYLDSKWIIELQFEESIIIWHVATDICYHSVANGSTTVTEEMEATKILSYYMMYLLFICPGLPLSTHYTKFMQAYTKVKEFYDKKEFHDKEFYKLLREDEYDSSNQTVSNIQKLAHGLMENEDRWKIMSSVWVEMLCCAAKSCPVKNHIQELRRGGQFLTHVWLLLMHLGVTKMPEKKTSHSLELATERDFIDEINRQHISNYINKKEARANTKLTNRQQPKTNKSNFVHQPPPQHISGGTAAATSNDLPIL
ncbi:hypothetical protein HYC85_009191 [Camellia sinensis]|uniref:DUF4220 domain-containing protein n=1 Tax=Camellia sinensis TaxID=4442 RepID=A0A7J7HFI9_CAMSI|nr:hypothetical protein HYC85_009191 [Camellia sinensis]